MKRRVYFASPAQPAALQLATLSPQEESVFWTRYGRWTDDGRVLNQFGRTVYDLRDSVGFRPKPVRCSMTNNPRPLAANSPASSSSSHVAAGGPGVVLALIAADGKVLIATAPRDLNCE